MCEYCRRYTCPSSCPNAPEPPIFGKCSSCGTDIKYGYDYYDIDGYYYCERCIDKHRMTAELEDV